MQTNVQVLWFKRDLRIQDHAALFAAAKAGPVLPVFVWDAAVWSSPDYSTQHVMFVRECLHTLKCDLQSIGLDLIESTDGILNVLNYLFSTQRIAALYSHEETGNQSSYTLDIQVAAWCQQHQVCWHEYPQNGVVRRLKSRNSWHIIWQKRMAAAQFPVPTATLVQLAKPAHALLYDVAAEHLQKPQPDKAQRQKGGRNHALKMLNSFLNGRASQYRGGISSPISSITAGSRISPYLAWGVLSMKEVMQALRLQHARIKQNPDKYPKKLDSGLIAFESRMHWHCHFMQKLESEPAIEKQNLHSALNGIRDEDYADGLSQQKLQAWITGRTGWPLVDACMAMLHATGWINFRMRAMLMSTASYLYWLHWREPGLHLAREFLDYEAGIHWPQVQMQSGTTGINTLRIYNPVKQAIDQDPDGHFVRKWLPALSGVPTAWIFEPWLMTPALQLQYKCILGQDYPEPMITLAAAFSHARARLALAKPGAIHIAETKRIIDKHASRKRRPANKASKSVNDSEPIHENCVAVQQSLF
jgi:deoxyribodipyrimidine photo-lyase